MGHTRQRVLHHLVHATVVALLVAACGSPGTTTDPAGTPGSRAATPRVSAATAQRSTNATTQAAGPTSPVTTPVPLASTPVATRAAAPAAGPTSSGAPAVAPAVVTTVATPALSMPPAPARPTGPGTAPTPAALADIQPVRDPGLVPSRLEVAQVLQQGVFAQEHVIQLPAGFHINLFASGLSGARGLAVGPDGNLYVTLMGSQSVVVLRDPGHTGVSTERATAAAGLQHPHGVAFVDGWMYVGETGKVERFPIESSGVRSDRREVIVQNLPNDGGHSTRTVHIGPDQKLYVSIGSSCNVCIEKDPRRASIVQYNLDGSNEHIFARGLRNAVGFTFDPTTGLLWATVNGRDNLGDDLPGEAITVVRDGDNLGWPSCYGARLLDPQFGKPDLCKDTIVPTLQIQAHSAPLGAAFYTGAQFPAEYQHDLFVPLHGSWNRTTPTGYKVVRVKRHDGGPAEVQDFATGWLVGGKSWGRPVDVAQGVDGSLYISDDDAGAVYRVWYGGKS